MSEPHLDQDQPVAWKAVTAGTRVRAADGSTVGEVVDVLGASTEDIFHGFVVKRPGGEEVVLLADDISRMTVGRVEVDLGPDAVAGLPPYRPEETFHLGLTGLLRKHEGWIRDR